MEGKEGGTSQPPGGLGQAGGTLPWLNKVTQVGGFGLWLGGEEAEEEKSKEIIIQKLETLTIPWEVLDRKGWLQQVDSFCY